MFRRGVQPTARLNTKWSRASPSEKNSPESIRSRRAESAGEPIVVDFVAVRTIKVHNFHQVI